MNKVKMFFVAAAMLLTTAGVFAGRAKFVNYTLYASSNGTSGTPIESASAALAGSLSLTTGTPISITGTSAQGLYAVPAGGGTYTRVRTSAF